MDKILLEIDERDFQSNKLNEPNIQIRYSPWNYATKIIARGNLAGFQKLASRFEEFEVNAIGVSLAELTDVIDCLPQPSKIIDVGASSSMDDANASRDISALSRLPSLRVLSIDPATPDQPIAAHAPQVKFLTVGDTTRKTLAGLDCLEGLRIMGSPKNLDTLNRGGLRTLFLQAFDQKQADLVLPCTELRTLSILTRKSDLSFAFLHDLPMLENFNFDGPAQQDWSSLPETLRKISIAKVDDRRPMVRVLNNADVVSIGFNPKIRGDDGFYKGDLLKTGDPFRTIEGLIFMADVL